MKIDTSLLIGQSKNLTGTTDALSNLHVGDVVRARILDITSNELLLKLFDGSTFTAATMVPVDAKPGTTIDLVVKGKNGGQLMMETVKSSGLPNNAGQLAAAADIKQQLLALGVKPSDTNMEIANQIKRFNLPLDKQTFDKINDTIEHTNGMSPAKAAFMIAGDIKVEEKNISALNQLIDGKEKISSNLNHIKNLLNEIDDESLLRSIAAGFQEYENEGNTAKIAPTANTANTVNTADTADTADDINKTGNMKSTVISNESDASSNAGIPNSTKLTGNTGNAGTDANIFVSAEKSAGGNGSIKAMDTANGSNTGTDRGQNAGPVNTSPSDAENLASIKDVLSRLAADKKLPVNADTQEIIKDLHRYIDDDTSLTQDARQNVKALLDRELVSFAKGSSVLKNDINTVIGKVIEQLEKNSLHERTQHSIGIGNLQDTIDALIENTQRERKHVEAPPLSQPRAEEQAKTGGGAIPEKNMPKEALKKAFEDFFIKIDSDIQKDDININKLFKDIYAKLEIIREHVEGAAAFNGKNEVLNFIDKLENNIRFMNEISSYSTYVQIPMNIGNDRTTGELYVLRKDPRRKKIDPENATVLVSLNTENLGQVDSLISVNKKNISLNMRVEDDDVVNFIKDNFKELYNKLSSKGYKLVDIKYRIIEELVNLLNVKDIVGKENDSGRVSIDYRL